MDKALWNGKVYTAIEISKDFDLENEIRKASGRKELRCFDSYCSSPIVKYRHGEKKRAHFAHFENCNCDYADYDKETSDSMQQVKLALFENLKRSWFKVDIDAKIIPHHYTHLLLTFPKNKRIAIELGTQKTSANRIEHLSKQYAAAKVELKWIIVSDENAPVKENEAFFLKRYLLNKNKNKDVLIINEAGTEVTQYVVDPTKYAFEGRIIHSQNYPDFYRETSSLDNLVVEDGELTIKGFHTRYKAWLEKKTNAFIKRLLQMADEKSKAEIEKKQQEKLQREKERREKERREKINQDWQRYQQESQNKARGNAFAKSQPIMSYEERRQSIMPKMDQQVEVVRDAFGTRWARCEKCGKIDMESNFPIIGGLKRTPTLGICSECMRNK